MAKFRVSEGVYREVPEKDVHSTNTVRWRRQSVQPTSERRGVDNKITQRIPLSLGELVTASDHDGSLATHSDHSTWFHSNRPSPTQAFDFRNGDY
jgi:hypothetical protein